MGKSPKFYTEVLRPFAFVFRNYNSELFSMQYVYFLTAELDGLNNCKSP